MANRKVRTSVVSANHSTEEEATMPVSAKAAVVQLRSELESERKRVLELRRERTYELQTAREEERDRAAAAAAKEMEAKFRQTRDQETRLLRCRQKAEIENVVRQKDRELKRLRRDLVRCQDDLKDEIYRRGLSASARVAFELERTKMLQEIRELGASKKRLEDALGSATEKVKQKTLEIRQLQETTRDEIAKVNREANAEITQILRELKTKDRLALLTKGGGSCAKRLLPAFHPTAGNQSDRSTSASNFAAETESWSKNLSTVKESLQAVKCGRNLPNFSVQRRLYDLEKQLGYLASVSRKFTEKNNQLRRTNEDLEQRIASLTEQNRTLNAEVRSAKGENKRLKDLMDTSGVKDLTSTIEDLCNQIRDYETIANSEKNKLPRKTVKFLLAYEDRAVSPMKELSYDDGGGGGGRGGGRGVRGEEGGGGWSQEEDRSAKQTSAAGISAGEDRMTQDWQIQQESLSIVIQTLEDKLTKYEENEDKLQSKLLEASDRNEELEFQILELENTADEKESCWLKEKEILRSELSKMENKLTTTRNDSSNVMERNVATQCDQEMLNGECKEDQSIFHDLTDDHKLSARTKVEWCGDVLPKTSANEIDNKAPPREDIRPTKASAANLFLDIKMTERREDGRWDATEDGGDDDDGDRGPMVHGISESSVDGLRRKLMRSQIREQQMKDQMLLLAEEKDRHIRLLQRQIECLESNSQDSSSASAQKFTHTKHGGAGDMERPSPEGLEDGGNSRELSGIDEGKGGGRTVRLKLDTALHWIPSSNEAFCSTPLSGDCDDISRRLERRDFREEQLCRQISDLERDRDMLHEVIHNNEGTIQALQADVDKLRQSEKDLCRIVSRLESAEAQLHAKTDNMAACNADVERRLKQLMGSESVLSSNLKKSRSAETDLKIKVDELTEARYACEAAWKRRLLEADAENRCLSETVRELDEQVGELESTECLLKQKLKRKEKSENSLLAELEVVKHDLNVALNHVSDLEYEKESLTQKLEKSFMDLTVETIRNKRETEATNVRMVEINCKIKVLEQSICAKETTISVLESKVMELESRELKTREDHCMDDTDRQFALHNFGKPRDLLKDFTGFWYDECVDGGRPSGGGGDGGGNTSSCSISSVLSSSHETPSNDIESADEASDIVDEDDGADFVRRADGGAGGRQKQFEYLMLSSSKRYGNRSTESPTLDSNCDSGMESLRQDCGYNLRLISDGEDA